MIGVIDYGMGNIQSVVNAFQRIGADVGVVTTARQIAESEGIILPGVGAFNQAMENLSKQNLVSQIQKSVESGVPLLGICLGLQLLAESSEEFGYHEGLGLMPGVVSRIPENPGCRVPHIGWNEVKIASLENNFLFAGIENSDCFYFVHSYALSCDSKYVSGITHHGSEITASIQHKNIFATQFHPEKSQTNGLKLLRNFKKYVENNCVVNNG